MNDILDFSLDNEERMKLFILYYKEHHIDTTLELLNRITGIYQFSGIKVLENFLYDIAIETNI